MTPQKHIYFASDFHLGAPNHEQSLKREKVIVQWLQSIESSCEELHLVGDVFDFWYEWKKVVPRGYTRFFGQLAKMSDAGIPIHYYTGNHDVWAFDYLSEELGLHIHRDSVVREWNSKRFFIHHGDGLGPGDGGYKLIKKIFRNPACQWIYSRLHPNFSSGLAEYFSKTSRDEVDETQFKDEKEWLVQYAREKLQNEHFDFFIFGHRHIAKDYKLSETSRYINLGEWMVNRSYAQFDGNNLSLKIFKP